MVIFALTVANCNIPFSQMGATVIFFCIFNLLKIRNQQQRIISFFTIESNNIILYIIMYLVIVNIFFG
jgi:hypothetical protein